MKTKEELNAIKDEVEALGEELAKLTDEEIEKVAGGRVIAGFQYDADLIKEGRNYQPPMPGPTPTPLPRG